MTLKELNQKRWIAEGKYYMAMGNLQNLAQSATRWQTKLAIQHAMTELKHEIALIQTKYQQEKEAWNTLKKITNQNTATTMKQMEN
jgi:ferric-dicitrate binding protein FerR (iron transport regulator)